MKIKLLAFLVFCFSQTFAQNISFSDLISFVNKSSWEPVNQSLMNKGWNFYGSTEDEKIEWSYGKDESDKAIGWIKLFTSDGIPQSISFQFHTKAIFNAIQKSILAYGFSKFSSSIVDDGLLVFYTHKKYTASLITTKNEDEYSASNIYSVVLRKSLLEPIETEKPMLKNGVTKDYDESGNLVCECTYKNNILNGPFKQFYDGQIVETGTYLQGKKNGKFKSYVNGKIDIDGTYKNDEFNGFQMYYFYDAETGKLTSRSYGFLTPNGKQGLWKDLVYIIGKEVVYQYFTYKDDLLNGSFKRIEGSEIIIGNYVQAELDGPYKLYVDYLTIEGNPLYGDLSKAYLKEEGFYKNGLEHGKWRYYDENKKLIEEVTYLDGVRQ